MVTLALYPRACAGVSVLRFFVASTEVGVPLEHHIGNICVFHLSARFSPYFDAIFKSFGKNQADRYGDAWTIAKDRVSRHQAKFSVLKNEEKRTPFSEEVAG